MFCFCSTVSSHATVCTGSPTWGGLTLSDKERALRVPWSKELPVGIISR